MRYSIRNTLAGVAICTLFSTVTAHSWVENVQRIAANGTIMDPLGYARDFQPRVSGFTDTQAEWKIVGPTNSLNTYMMCKPAQDIGANKAEYPRLKAAAGDFVALRYLENGHATMKYNNLMKSQNQSGTVFIYGTANPKPSSKEKLMDIHKVWNADGTGGDGRGRLLATRPFDDGACYQTNAGTDFVPRKAAAAKTDGGNPPAELMCQTDFQIPSNVTNGTYTIYWVWDWPTYNSKQFAATATGSEDKNGEAAAHIATNEMYTTCIDIDVSGRDSLASKAASFQAFDANQPSANRALKPQVENSFQVIKEIQDLLPGGSSDANPSTSAHTSTSPAQTSSSHVHTSSVPVYTSSAPAHTSSSPAITVTVTTTVTAAPTSPKSSSTTSRIPTPKPFLGGTSGVGHTAAVPTPTGFLPSTKRSIRRGAGEWAWNF